MDRAKVIAGKHQDLPTFREAYLQIACKDAEQRALEVEVARSDWN